MAQGITARVTRSMKATNLQDDAAESSTNPASVSKTRGSAKKAAVVEKPSNKAAGMRKSTDDHDGAVRVRSAKNIVQESEENAESEKKAGKTVKGAEKSKGKKKEEPVAIAKEPEAPIASKAKNSKSNKAAGSKTKVKSPSPPPEEPEADEQSQDETDTGGQVDDGVELFGFSTDDDDSSDEEMNDEPDAIDVSKLPTIAKDDATVQRKLEKAKKKPVRYLRVFP
jgi:nucleolar protein 15